MKALDSIPIESFVSSAATSVPALIGLAMHKNPMVINTTWKLLLKLSAEPHLDNASFRALNTFAAGAISDALSSQSDWSDKTSYRKLSFVVSQVANLIKANATRIYQQDCDSLYIHGLMLFRARLHDDVKQFVNPEGLEEIYTVVIPRLDSCATLLFNAAAVADFQSGRNPLLIIQSTVQSALQSLSGFGCGDDDELDSAQPTSTAVATFHVMCGMVRDIASLQVEINATELMDCVKAILLWLPGVDEVGMNAGEVGSAVERLAGLLPNSFFYESVKNLPSSGHKWLLMAIRTMCRPEIANSRHHSDELLAIILACLAVPGVNVTTERVIALTALLVQLSPADAQERVAADLIEIVDDAAFRLSLVQQHRKEADDEEREKAIVSLSWFVQSVECVTFLSLQCLTQDVSQGLLRLRWGRWLTMRPDTVVAEQLASIKSLVAATPVAHMAPTVVNHLQNLALCIVASIDEEECTTTAKNLLVIDALQLLRKLPPVTHDGVALLWSAATATSDIHVKALTISVIADIVGDDSPLSEETYQIVQKAFETILEGMQSAATPYAEKAMLRSGGCALVNSCGGKFRESLAPLMQTFLTLATDTSTSTPIQTFGGADAFIEFTQRNQEAPLLPTSSDWDALVAHQLDPIGAGVVAQPASHRPALRRIPLNVSLFENAGALFGDSQKPSSPSDPPRREGSRKRQREEASQYVAQMKSSVEQLRRVLTANATTSPKTNATSGQEGGAAFQHPPFGEDTETIETLRALHQTLGNLIQQVAAVPPHARQQQ